jgi:hypothetical protein
MNRQRKRPLREEAAADAGKDEMILKIDRQIDVVTDTATLAFFDPVALKHRADGKQDWFATRAEAQKEIARGRMVLIPTPMDGRYRVRITTGDLTAEERELLAATDKGFWIEVTGSRLRIGAAENLPGATNARTDTADQTILVPNGRYRLTLYALNTPSSPPTGLPNVVIQLASAADEVTAAQPKKNPELWPKIKSARRRPKRSRKSRANMQTAGVMPLHPGQPAEFEFQMNTTLLGLFDPAELQHTAEWPVEWTDDQSALLKEARSGKVAFARAGAILFKTAVVRIQMEVLSIQQVAEVAAVAPQGWFNVSSGEVICASSEEWPPYPLSSGRVLSLEKGRYAATFHFLKPEQARFPIIIEIHPLHQKKEVFPTDVVDSLPLRFDRRK